MNVGVIGTGYVGLVAGACFADSGNTVFCVDRDQKKIERLKKGEIPIYEPGLETLVRRGIAQERLQFTTSTEEAVHNCEVIFMAVGTPSREDGSADLSFLEAAAGEVGQAMNGFKLIVNKSTVPVGSHKRVHDWISAETEHPFEVVSNPEFLKEGTAVDDFLKPDRVIIGTKSDKAYQKMAELYRPFVRQGNPIFRMDPVSAEVAKYASNSFLATRISFMNELSVLCEKVGADIEDIRKGMATDPRIGKQFLYAGAGYGGSCFPKDVKALIHTGQEMDVPLKIVEATHSANDRQKLRLAHHVVRHFGEKLSGKTFALWGLAFKPNTDDIREAPALTLIEELSKRGAKIRAFDPVAMPNTKAEVKASVDYCSSPYEAAQDADAMILVTEWNEFRTPDFERLKKSLKSPVVFDGRNIFDPKQITGLGFQYYGIGRTSS